MKTKKYDNPLLKATVFSTMGKNSFFLENRETFLPKTKGNIIKSTDLEINRYLHSGCLMEKINGEGRSIFPKKEQRSRISPSCYKLIDLNY